MFRIYLVILLLVFTGCNEKQKTTANTSHTETAASPDVDILNVNNSENNNSIDLNSSESNVSTGTYDSQRELNSSVVDINITETNHSED